MSAGIFLDREHRPSAKEIESALGKRYPLFRQLVDFMQQGYGLEGDLSFGGKNYGWNLWFRKGGKTLLNLYPHDGYCVAQVVLGKALSAEARSLKLGKRVGEVFAAAPEFFDGRWLFVPVKTARDAKDIQALVALKRKPAPAGDGSSGHPPKTRGRRNRNP